MIFSKIHSHSGREGKKREKKKKEKKEEKKGKREKKKEEKRKKKREKEKMRRPKNLENIRKWLILVSDTFFDGTELLMVNYCQSRHYHSFQVVLLKVRGAAGHHLH